MAVSRHDVNARKRNETEVCAFLRRAISSAIGEPVRVTRYPERRPGGKKRVEQLWKSPSHRFAIEHTELEAFEGFIREDELFKLLMIPLEAILAGRVPGTFALTLEAGEFGAARVRHLDVAAALGAQVIEVGPTLEVGQRVTLQSPLVPVRSDLERRSATDSRVLVRRSVSDLDARRVEQVRRTVAKKCPKLAAERARGRISILALESSDHLTGTTAVTAAVREALSGRDDHPDIVIHVDTMNGWLTGRLVENRSVVRLPPFMDNPRG